MPYSAALPVPAISAAGVAKPSAHGQETTSTLTALFRALSAPAPRIIHTIKVTTAMPITDGTNIPATLSASFAIGTFVEFASSTSFTILYNVVSSPTETASAVA